MPYPRPVFRRGSTRWTPFNKTKGGPKIVKPALVILIIALMIIATPMDTSNLGESLDTPKDIVTNNYSEPSANSAILASGQQYIVIEMTGGDITSHGDEWSQLLNASGIVSNVVEASDVITTPDILDDSPAIVVDASIGSSNGSIAPQALIDILVQKDISLILTGRSSWILHRLRGTDPPSLMAPATIDLLESAEYAGAVFMTSPIPLSVGTPLTTETGIILPLDQKQTSTSRIVDLTGAAPSSIAGFRYDSYPLDA
ncbi:MAG: hypothetical protein ACFFBJ_04545, partial [Promethearchaeota archaeon]